MLRVYAAAHGLTGAQHAVVEVGAKEIVLRVEPRWVRFTWTERTGSDGLSLPFFIGEDGSVTMEDVTEEMDMAAERVARELLAG